MGYFGEIFITMAFAYGYLIIHGISLILFISMCLHHQAFSKIFKHTIEKTKECHAKFLRDLIGFHLTAKEYVVRCADISLIDQTKIMLNFMSCHVHCRWFLHSAHIYKSFVLVQLICSTIVLAVSVFYMDLVCTLKKLFENFICLKFKVFFFVEMKILLFQQWQHHIDFTMVTVLMTSSIGISTLLLYCYFGKLATDSYAEMSDCIFNMNWCEQSIELQKYFILMIENMQKSIYYHGFEIAKMDLETFIKVSQSFVCLLLLDYVWL